MTKIETKNLLRDRTCFNCLYNHREYCREKLSHQKQLPKIKTCEFWSNRTVYSKYIPVIKNVIGANSNIRQEVYKTDELF